MTRLRIEIWSDIACPWCYIGKRRLERALGALSPRASVRVLWRSFELNPSAPRSGDEGPYVDRLAKKYGTTVSEAKVMISRVSDVAKAEGLDFAFEAIRPSNTFDAHRLLHLAEEHGLQDAMKERLFLGYFTQGESMGDADALFRLAVECGLKSELVRALLEGNGFAGEVREDERKANELGIHGVPFFLMGGRYAVSGAQPTDVLRETLEQAQHFIETKPTEYAEGAHCGPDGC